MREPFVVLIILLGLLVGSAAGATGGAPDVDGYDVLLPPAPGKNLIVISFDALRVDALGAYGDTLGASPNMDAFARTALVCERAYTAAQSTPTSFAAAFTGRHPFNVFQGWTLEPTPTLAGVLQDAGYRTAAFLNNRQLDAERGFDQGFTDYEAVYETDEERFLDLPEAWLQDHADEQLFLWVHFISPHAPYTRRDMAAQFYTPGYEGTYAEVVGGGSHGYLIENPQDLARAKELYVGEVYYADALFGRLVRTLEELGLMDSSIVVLTADHGEEHMDHGVFGHKQVYDEVVHIPLMIHHPDAPQGRRSREIFMNLDFLPTFADLLGLESPSGLDGVNVLAVRDPDRPIVSTAMTNNRWFSMGMRRGDFKVIVPCIGKKKFKLFDLANDPGELRNLGRSQRQLAASLRAQLKRIAGGDPCSIIRSAVRKATVETNLSEEKIQQLRALGY